MRRNRKKNTKLLLILLIVGLTVGFAALATTLKINGSASLGKNTWRIYWDNVGNVSKTEAVDVLTGATIDPLNEKELYFSVTLNEPGDYYEFQVDATNGGTLDAMVGIVKTTINDDEDEELPPYINYSVTYADGSELGQYQILPRADSSTTPATPTRERIKVRIELSMNITQEQLESIGDDDTYDICVEIPYDLADDHAYDRNVVEFVLPEGKTAETLTVGDEICVKDQCFNFVRYDEHGDAVLLAKWNLNVGSSPKGGTETFIQDSEVRGDWNDNGTMRDYGRVTFGTSSYWYDFDNYVLKSKYGSSFPATIYDPDLDGNPGTQTYSIAYYVKRYKTILEGAEYGATIKTARLLLHEEAKGTLGCPANPDLPKGPCTTTGDVEFVTNTDYWLGTAYNYYYLYRVDFGSMSDEGAEAWHGVRPVIVVEKSNL